MLEAESTVTARTVRSKGRVYQQLIIYLPRDLIKDSQFPFKPGDRVRIRIEGQGLRIEKKNRLTPDPG